MNALAGCLWRDGRRASETDLVTALASIPHRAPQGLPHASSGPVVLAAPDVAAGARVDPRIDDVDVAAFHGRLDNAEEIRGRLGCAPSASDAALVLAAYREAGPAAGGMFEGDFACAVWDARSRTLVCLRDALGGRPLFYAMMPGAVVIGSEAQQVLRHAGIPRRVDEGIVAEHLTGAPSSIDRTLWAAVRRLPPGHALTIAPGGHAVATTWDFDPGFDAGCRSDGEYAERFRELLIQAVRRRAGHRPAVFLSGGLDSSAVASVAAADLRSAASPAPALRAFSVTFPGRACDETAFIDPMLRFCRLDGHQLAASPLNRSEVVEEVDRFLDVPAYPNGSVMDPLRRRAAALGNTIVMTGYGGDEWFAGRPPGRVRLAGVRRGLARGLPRPLRAGLRRLSRRDPGACDWIAPAFHARVGVPERMAPPSIPPFERASQREIYRVVRSALQMTGDEFEERSAAVAGIDQRHPFYDRRLAEFGFSLPDAQRFSDGRSKAIIRRALTGLLPPAVLDRSDKAEFSGTFVEALENLGGLALFQRLRVEDLGWVDGEAIRRRYGRMIKLYRRGDRSYIPWTNGLWEVAGLELWVRRAVEGDRS